MHTTERLTSTGLTGAASELSTRFRGPTPAAPRLLPIATSRDQPLRGLRRGLASSTRHNVRATFISFAAGTRAEEFSGSCFRTLLVCAPGRPADPAQQGTDGAGGWATPRLLRESCSAPGCTEASPITDRVLSRSTPASSTVTETTQGLCT